MKIVDENNCDFIQLKLVEVLPDYLPTLGDRKFSIKVNSRDFLAEIETVWFDYDAIQKFVANINRMEKLRNGEAQITSMSPNKFCLRIGFYDGWGHVFFEGHVGEQYYDGIESKIGFSIRPDTSMFDQYVSQLNLLLTS